jgi:DNA-binding transcriptional ArsR family regulator
VFRGVTTSDRHVSDPSALKALAHPLRVRLLAALRETGPATATELAERLGTESGSTSYHLRVLARHGFVDDVAAEGGTKRHHRERRWAAVHQTSSWSNSAMADSPTGSDAAALMRRRQLEVLVEDVDHFDRGISDLPPEWVEAAGIGDLMVRLTPAALSELWDGFYAHLDELRARESRSPDAAPVSIVVAGFPRPDKA